MAYLQIALLNHNPVSSFAQWFSSQGERVADVSQINTSRKSFNGSSLKMPF